MFYPNDDVYIVSLRDTGEVITAAQEQKTADVRRDTNQTSAPHDFVDLEHLPCVKFYRGPGFNTRVRATGRREMTFECWTKTGSRLDRPRSK